MVDKVLYRSGGQTKQYTPVTTSAGAGSAGKIPALNSSGLIDSSMYISNTGLPTQAIVAFETIGAGKYVNIFDNAGTLNVRLADNSNNRPAHGFSIAGGASAATITVQDLDDINTGLSSLTLGSTYYLGTAGGVISTPLDPTTATTGYIDQKLGVARSATELKGYDFDYVVM